MREIICFKNKLKFSLEDKKSLEASKMNFIAIITLAILMLINKYSVMAAKEDDGDIRIDDNGYNMYGCPPEPQRPGMIQPCHHGPIH